MQEMIPQEELIDYPPSFIIVPRDINALLEAMLILIKDRNKRRKMSEKSLEWINRFFAYDKVISNYIRFYKGLGICNE